jgi:AraC family transcriptional regulator
MRIEKRVDFHASHTKLSCDLAMSSGEVMVHERSTETVSAGAILASAGGWDIELLPAGAYEVRYVSPRCTIGVALDPQMGVHAIGTDRRQNFRAKVGVVGLIPAGCDVYSSSRYGGEYLRLSAPASLEARIEKGHRQDETFLQLARELRRWVMLGADALICEAIAEAIVDRLSCSADGEKEQAKGWITSRRLRDVEEYIQETLGGPILVSDLAMRLGLSTTFFSRAFKEATGRSPQEHIIQRRLQRASVLMLSTKDSLAAVAAECGFASHSHMSTLFRDRLGLSPSELRGSRPHLALEAQVMEHRGSPSDKV